MTKPTNGKIRWSRTIGAIIIAPIVGVLPIALFAQISGHMPFLLVLLFGYLYAFPMVLLGLFPLHLSLHRYRKPALVSYISFSGIIVTTTWLYLNYAQIESTVDAASITMDVFVAIGSMLGGAVFYFIAVPISPPKHTAYNQSAPAIAINKKPERSNQ